MTLGSRITQLRKDKTWSQSHLAKEVAVSREIIGRYERDDAVPSIDVAKRMAEALEVSLDYLVGAADQKIDQPTLQRIQEISRLGESEKTLVYEFLDAFIFKSKIKGAL